MSASGSGLSAVRGGCDQDKRPIYANGMEKQQQPAQEQVVVGHEEVASLKGEVCQSTAVTQSDGNASRPSRQHSHPSQCRVLLLAEELTGATVDSCCSFIGRRAIVTEMVCGGQRPFSDSWGSLFAVSID